MSFTHHIKNGEYMLRNSLLHCGFERKLLQQRSGRTLEQHWCEHGWSVGSGGGGVRGGWVGGGWVGGGGGGEACHDAPVGQRRFSESGTMRAKETLTISISAPEEVSRTRAKARLVDGSKGVKCRSCNAALSRHGRKHNRSNNTTAKTTCQVMSTDGNTTQKEEARRTSKRLDSGARCLIFLPMARSMASGASLDDASAANCSNSSCQKRVTHSTQSKTQRDEDSKTANVVVPLLPTYLGGTRTQPRLLQLQFVLCERACLVAQRNVHARKLFDGMQTRGDDANAHQLTGAQRQSGRHEQSHGHGHLAQSKTGQHLTRAPGRSYTVQNRSALNSAPPNTQGVTHQHRKESSAYVTQAKRVADSFVCAR
jgi:hypothetical protein